MRSLPLRDANEDCPDDLARPAGRWAVVPTPILLICVWGALTTLLEWQHLLQSIVAQRGVGDSLRLLAAAIPVGIGGAGALWLAITVSRRFRLRGKRWAHALVVHAAAALVAATYMSAIALLQYQFVPALRASGNFQLGVRILAEGLHYGVLAAGVYVVTLTRALRRAAVFDRRLQRAVWQADRERIRADLRALKAEISPRTLEVAVRSALADMRTDVGTAQRTLFAVASVMREAVLGAGVDVVTFEEERQAIDAFLHEMSDAAPVTWELDEGVDEALVPQSALWSLIVTAPGSNRDSPLVVRARRRGWMNRHLEISIDAGVSESTAGEENEQSALGVARTDRQALTSLRTWLTLMFGARALLHAGGTSGRGRSIRLVIPWRTDGDLTRDETERAPAAPWSSAAPGSEWSRARRLAVGLLVWGSAASIFTWQWIVQVPASLVATPPVGDLLLLACWRSAGIPLTGALAWFATSRAPFGVDGVGGGRAWSSSPSSWSLHLVMLLLSVCASYLGRAVEVGIFSRDVLAFATSATEVGPVIRALAAVILYALVSVVAHVDVLARRRQRALAAWRALRDRRADAVASRTSAELRALKAELNPHFVGNALHAAMSLMRTDTHAAAQLLESLVALSQRAAERVSLQEIALADEVADLEPFLAIERVRIGIGMDRLQVSFDIPAALALAAVPHFALQPLVENAVRHGLAPTGRGGHIVIRARRQENGLLAVEVEDDGVGPTGGTSRLSAPGIGAGSGTGTMRRRLRSLYGPAARFDLVPAPFGGSIARLLIPCRIMGTPTGKTWQAQ